MSEKKYNFIDADTLVVQSTVIEQYNYTVYKDGEKIGPTKSQKQWKKDHPDENPDDYKFVQEAVLKGGKLAPLSRAVATFKKKVKAIEKKYPDHISIICIEGDGNYRDDLYPAYKGQREGEILLRERLNDWIKVNWDSNRLIVAEGHETDDEVGMRMWKAHKIHEETGEWPWIISSCDKDLRTVAGKLYNYCKDEETIISVLEADRWFCSQLLQGDKVDNIKGLNAKLPKEFLKPFGIRAVAGTVGDGTATKLLAECETSQECFQKVVDCYKEVHGDKWLMMMQEEALALRMCHTRAEMETGSHYQIKTHLTHLKIDCE